MNILIISQCSKNALKETRRIVDQFAERKGERVWQTAITKQGLDTLYKMLRKSARKNTAVACHWIRGKNRSEVLWFVGDVSRFTSTGTVPTNSTNRDILRSTDENDWNTGEEIRLFTALSALFHDFGKCTQDFQDSLKRESNGKNRNIIRHEWISVLIFEAMTMGKTDKEWLKELEELEKGKRIDMKYKKDVLAKLWETNHTPFKNLPPIARFVAWLIVSHHRLPINSKTVLEHFQDNWLTNPFYYMDVTWNYYIEVDNEKRRKALKTLEELPFESDVWRKRTSKIAKAILKTIDLAQIEKELSEENHYMTTYSRLVLMLADHIYSSKKDLPEREKGDESYNIIANTKNQGEPNQRLDEHVVGVEKMSHRILFELMSIDNAFSRIARHKLFRKNTKIKHFMWQNEAFRLAESLREEADKGGFFGINMASTGCGKTIANGRIMYALADQDKGARFTIALGLRVLTLQTGQTYRNMMGLNESDLGILVGGQTYKELNENKDEFKGSESAEELMPENSYVHYEGALDTGPFAEWISSKKGVLKLLSSPVLICTIDHLIPASETIRGGKQIAPMLRLMTSDLILDEPDDFDVDDLYALSRLVYFAGLVGSRVLLSSATITPAIAEAFYSAYLKGRSEFNKNRGETEFKESVCCAWFNEYGCTAGKYNRVKDFIEKHKVFVNNRVKNLNKEKVYRRGMLIPFKSGEETEEHIAEIVQDYAIKFHNNHHTETIGGKRMSFGLVRMANIRNLVKTVQAFAKFEPKEGVCFHFCCYHSRYPMIMRSNIESVLDDILNRKGGRTPEHNEFVAEALKKKGRDHIFIIFASPVAEVGRDHDYDWGIIEPSSMRSIIQLAGRIMRHRYIECENSNIAILSKNLRSAKSERAFCLPGFEKGGEFIMDTHNLEEALEKEQYEVINSIPRLFERVGVDVKRNLSDFEHYVLRSHLIESSETMPASLFWDTKAFLTGIMQCKKPFRAGSPEKGYFLRVDENGEEDFYILSEYLDSAEKSSIEDCQKRNSDFEHKVELNIFESNSPFIKFDYAELINNIADEKNITPEEASLRYGTFGVPDGAKSLYYHPFLGIWDE